MRDRKTVALVMALAVLGSVSVASIVAVAGARREIRALEGRLRAVEDEAARRYLDAKVLKEWVTAYKCLTQVPADIPIEAYVKEMENSSEETLDYGVSGYTLHAPDRATVSVRYEYRFGDSGKEVSKTANWRVWKDNGVWKVRWMPEQ